MNRKASDDEVEQQQQQQHMRDKDDHAMEDDAKAAGRGPGLEFSVELRDKIIIRNDRLIPDMEEDARNVRRILEEQAQSSTLSPKEVTEWDLLSELEVTECDSLSELEYAEQLAEEAEEWESGRLGMDSEHLRLLTPQELAEHDRHFGMKRIEVRYESCVLEAIEKLAASVGVRTDQYLRKIALDHVKSCQQSDT